VKLAPYASHSSMPMAVSGITIPSRNGASTPGAPGRRSVLKSSVMSMI
jgi:hypothetical protein